MSDVVTSWGCAARHPEHGRRRRDAFLQGDAIVVRSVDRKGRTRPWTQPGSPLTLPDHVAPGSLRIHAVVPHEWSTDLVVEFGAIAGGGRQVEVWRASPVRILEGRVPIPSMAGAVHGVQCGEATATGRSERLLDVMVRDDLRVWTTSIRTSATEASEVTDQRSRTRTYDLFVSYKSNQEEFAARVVRLLAERGLDIWFAPERYKSNFTRQVPDLIDESDNVLVLWSEGSDKNWDQAGKFPKEPPYKQVHEIRAAWRDIRRTNVMICLLDSSSVREAIRERVHVYERAEAAQRTRVNVEDMDDDRFAIAVADYVFTVMQNEAEQ
jgi:hypothetical protein